MSAVTAAAGVVNDVAGDVAGEKEKPSRKFPLPCWTQGETLALIDAYRERWYALRRGYLRTADWDAVAAAVGSCFPDVTPAKTSAQCRHKMEKLRQRYRAEKQRSLSFPAGRFFSSWFFFENMDAMEIGTDAGSGQDLGNSGNSGNGIKPDAFFDQNIMKVKLNNGRKFDHGVALKNSSNTFNGRMRPSFESKVEDVDFDMEEDDPGFGGGLSLKTPIIGLSAPRGSEGNKYARISGEFKTNMGFNSSGGKGYDAGDGFHIRSSGNESMLPPRLRVKRIGKEDGRVAHETDEIDAHDGFSARVVSDMNSVPSGIRGRYGRYMESEMANRESNGFSKTFGVEAEKRGRNGDMKREKNPIEEMVSAIKMLGEGFVKMEKLKMDMAMEIEKNRMEMELKRNELILQSQGQIVDAFARGLFEVNKKLKMATLPES